MDKLKSKIEKIKWADICVVTEYAAIIYIILAFGLKALQVAGLVTIQIGFIQPVSYGASFAVMLLLLYGLSGINRQVILLSKYRPYVAGIAIAGILSVDSLSLGLLFLLLIGYFFLTGYRSKFGLKELINTIIGIGIGLGIYSSIIMLVGAETHSNIDGFVAFIWSDFLFVIAMLLFCVLNGCKKEDVEEDLPAKRELTEVQTDNKYYTKLVACREWMCSNEKRIVRWGASCVCVLAIGLFVFYFTLVQIGTNRILNSKEEVYVLQHCEDDTLVLSLVEDEKNNGYTVAFQEYVGAANQKIELRGRGDGLLQLVFLEQEYALEVTWNEKEKKHTLCVNPASDNFQQCWIKEDFLPEYQMYRFLCAYSVPLCYEMLEQPNTVPEVKVQAETGRYEFFVLERTVSDDLLTKTVAVHADGFMPTSMIETVIGYLGGWSVLFFVMIVLILGTIIYMRRVVGDRQAVLYAMVFAYMLMYSSAEVILVLLLVYGIMCVNGYFRNQARQKKIAMEQHSDNISIEDRKEMLDSINRLEEELHNVQSYLKKVISD